MIIDVTAEDIRDGERDHKYRCAVALATRRATGSNRTVVTAQYLTIYNDDGSGFRQYYLSDSVALWIQRFDDGWDEMKPMTFSLLENHETTEAIEAAQPELELVGA